MNIRESRTRLRAAEQAYNTAKPGRDLTEARHELTCARGEYQAACVELVESLADVLEPWNEEADQWHETHPSGEVIYTDNITLGDLRRLSSIYKEISDVE